MPGIFAISAYIIEGQAIESALTSGCLDKMPANRSDLLSLPTVSVGM